MADSVNFESWPEPDEKMRNATLEKEVEVLLKCVSLVYAARQNARLKRRWPLNKMVVVAPKSACDTVRSFEDVLVELSNVKMVGYAQDQSSVKQQDWVSADEGDLHVFLDVHRDEQLLAEGLMRDLARRIQALRKELGYVPTDILEAVHVADLDEEKVRLLRPYVDVMAQLVRAKNVQLHVRREEVDTKWHQSQLDEKNVSIAIAESEAR
jgi:valyl-tRNA synthetase